jgi:hypothetical protein
MGVGACILVLCITVDIRLSLAIYKVGAGNVFTQHVTSNKHSLLYIEVMRGFYKFIKSTGSD